MIANGFDQSQLGMTSKLDSGVSKRGKFLGNHVTKVERQVHRLIVKDVRIVFAPKSIPRNTENGTLENPVSIRDQQTRSSPDSGLGDVDQGSTGDTSVATRPQQLSQRIRNLRALALKAKHADAFITPDPPEKNPNSPKISVEEEPVEGATSLPLVADEPEKPELNGPPKLLQTSSVRAGAIFLPGFTHQNGSKNQPRVSFHEKVPFENSFSSDDLAEETFIFPFIDSKVEPVQQNSNFDGYNGYDTASDKDSEGSETDLIQPETRHEIKLRTPKKKEQFVSENEIEVTSHPQPNMTTPTECSTPRDENGGDCVDGEVVFSLSDSDELNSPDFFQDFISEESVFESTSGVENFTQQGLVEVNSTPTLRKKTELKEQLTWNEADTQIGSLRRQKRKKNYDNVEAIGTQTICEACTQTKRVTTEESCQQKGAPLNEIDDTGIQTESLASHNSTQTRSSRGQKERSTQTFTQLKETSTGATQVSFSVFGTTSSCQTDQKELNSLECQTVSPDLTDNDVQATSEYSTQQTQTELKKMYNFGMQAMRLDIKAMHTQTSRAEFREMGFQTDKRVTIALQASRLTQTPRGDKRHVDSQIDSSITGVSVYAQTGVNWVNSSSSQTNSDANTNQMAIQTEIEKNLNDSMTQTENSTENDSIKEDIISLLEVKPQSLLTSEPSSTRLKSLNFDDKNPRASTPRTGSFYNFSSPRDVPKTLLPSPSNVPSSRTPLYSPLGTPRSLPSPRSGIDAEDDMHARLRKKALKAKIARTFAEGTPQSSPREDSMNRSNSSVGSNPADPLQLNKRLASRLAQEPNLSPRSPVDNKEIGTLKPILAKPKPENVSGSYSNLNSPRDLNVQSRRTGNRVRIKDFQVDQVNYSSTPTKSSTNKQKPKRFTSAAKSDSGGSTDSLIEELDTLLTKD